MTTRFVDGEPWVVLDNGDFFKNWSKEDEIRSNQQFRQGQKYEFYCQAFDFIADNRIDGDYLEFGCHRVRTFRMALTEARRHNLDSMQFLAFDSFAGLPEVETKTSVPIWKKGVLATSEQEFMRLVTEHGIYLDKVSTYPGFYNESLTPELQKQLLAKQRKAAFICVDCDLYESAVPVWKFIDGLLQEGSVLYVDDYYVGYKGSPLHGVAKSFAEYQETTSWRFEPHLSIGWWGRSFIAYK